MRKIALVLVGLYAALLLLLPVPVAVICFAPESFTSWKDVLGGYGAIVKCWFSWVVLAVLLLSEAALLLVPVRVAAGRPAGRRTLWLPVMAAGFLMAGLVFGVVGAVIEVLQRAPFFGEEWQGWTVLGACLLLWLGWGLFFMRVARTASADDVVTRQCRILIQGGVLSLLVAVPTHIVARHRDYCCAGFSTFLSIVFGLSVMLLAFGPGVLALYVARWRARHPIATPAPDTKG